MENWEKNDNETDWCGVVSKYDLSGGYKSIFTDSVYADSISALTKTEFNKFLDEEDLKKRAKTGLPVNMVLVPDNLLNTYKTLGLRVYSVSGLNFVMSSELEAIEDKV